MDALVTILFSFETTPLTMGYEEVFSHPFCSAHFVHTYLLFNTGEAMSDDVVEYLMENIS